MRSRLAFLGPLLLLPFAMTASAQRPPTIPGLEVGQPFPLTAFPSLEDGQPRSMAEFRGKRLILHVFASW